MVSPQSVSTLADVRIITLQGHPEFSPDIATNLINVREKGGILSKELAERSRGYAALHDEGLAIGAAFLELLSAY